ncbi:MAG TPA: sigma-70 family RNA polymerase sigma factor [Acidimicrobiales bacterium]|nr:sigma-70 family RNA polymerase sigma factor [Acidimicrobiales bacterium]
MAKRLNNNGNTTECGTAQVDEEQLVRDHLPLVHRAVSDMLQRVPRHVSRNDLLSAALAGLAQAARSFDPERGIAFDRFASARIRGALLDELRSRDWASRSVRAKARSVAGVTDELTATLGRAPTADEVATHMGTDKASLESLSGDVHRAVVLNFDSLVTDGDGSSILPADEKGPDAQLLDRERRAYLVDAVSALPERLRHVVIGYFFDERPMRELADELGVTESRISQMRSEALVLLRSALEANLEEGEPLVDLSPRAAKRTSAYLASVGAGRDWKSRLDPSSGPRLTTLS